MTRTFWMGSLLYLVGIVLATGLLAFSTWADFEGSLFEGGLPADEPLASLSCPVLLTRRGETHFSAHFENSLDRPVRRRMDVLISDGFVSRARLIQEDITLAPGDIQRLTWPISAADVVWNRFVLARIYVNRASPLPSLTGTCGVLYADTALLSGGQLLSLLLLLIVGTLGGGWLLWRRGGGWKRPRGRAVTQGLGALSAFLLIGLIAMLLGWWLVAAVMLLIATLLVIVLAMWLLGG